MSPVPVVEVFAVDRALAQNLPSGHAPTTNPSASSIAPGVRMLIEEFNAQLIERYLELRRLQFNRASNGREFLVQVRTEHCKVRVRLRVSGSKRNILTIRVTPAEHYQATQRQRLMELVNGWNHDTRWPKAYVRETSSPDRVGVVAENCYPMMDGIHFEAFTRYVDYTIGGAVELFDTISRGIELPSARTLDLWLRNDD
jgi:hypothetical protein